MREANHEGRIYSSGDLHAASLVWVDRRKSIERLLIKDYPQLSPADLMSVARAVQLYATCGEQLFCDLEAGQ
jgi:hypothetical protein